MRKLLAAALLASACAPADTVPDIATTTFAPSLNIDLSQFTLLSNGEYVRDTTVGTGAAIEPGQTLAVFYTVYLPDGTFEQTNVGASTFSFTLDANPEQVIAGWDQGFGAMNVGGTRQLIVPPALAYGDNTVGDIPPETILVFTVQVVSAQ